MEVSLGMKGRAATERRGMACTDLGESTDEVIAAADVGDEDLTTTRQRTG